MRCLEDVELKSALFSCTQYKRKDHELYKQCLQLHSGDPKREKRKHPSQHRGGEMAIHDKNSKSFERVI
jgi:hypothetical protein